MEVGNCLPLGPRPLAWRYCGARHLSPSPSRSQQRGESSPPPYTLPKPPVRGHAIQPPSLRPKALGFRLLLGANFLPLEKAGAQSGGSRLR